MQLSGPCAVLMGKGCSLSGLQKGLDGPILELQASQRSYGQLMVIADTTCLVRAPWACAASV